jgi:hypothetical protein
LSRQPLRDNGLPIGRRQIRAQVCQPLGDSLVPHRFIDRRTPQALGNLVRTEIDKWVPLIQSAGAVGESVASRGPYRYRGGVRQLEGWIAAQPVEVVAIGIAAANRQHASSQHIGDCVRDVQTIAPVGGGARQAPDSDGDSRQQDCECARQQ